MMSKTVALGDKRYSIPYVTGRALRELKPAWDAYQWMLHPDGETDDVLSREYQQRLDALVKWFCVFFGDQFTPDDVYDHYPSDKLVSDVVVALLATQQHVTDVLSEFPIPPRATTVPKT